jgi:hypothetical protein
MAKAKLLKIFLVSSCCFGLELCHGQGEADEGEGHGPHHE